MPKRAGLPETLTVYFGIAGALIRTALSGLDQFYPIYWAGWGSRSDELPSAWPGTSARSNRPGSKFLPGGRNRISMRVGPDA